MREKGGRERIHGKVPYPLVGGLRFEATTSFPFVPRTKPPPPSTRRANEHRQKGGGVYVRVAARYFYWPRLSEGLPGRGKKKGKKETKKKKEKKKCGAGEKKAGRRVSQSSDFFPP